MGIMSSNIFGPTSSTDVMDSGECGHHYYYIEPTRDILVNNYQQYIIHDKNYLRVAGTIRALTGAEVIVKGD